MKYALISCKGTRRIVAATLAAAVRAAKKMDDELQPAFGVRVWTYHVEYDSSSGGERYVDDELVAEVDGDRVEDAWGDPIPGVRS